MQRDIAKTPDHAAAAALNVLAQHTNTPFALLDASAQVVAASQAFAELLGMTSEQLHSSCLLEHGAPSLTKELRLLLPQLAAAGHCASDIDLEGMAVRLQLYPAAGGALVMLEGCAGKELDARQREEAQRRFIDDLAHQLQTPLTVIIGFCDTLLTKQGIAEETMQRFVEKIREQSIRLSTVLGDLMTISSLESSTYPLRLEPLDIRMPLALAAQDLIALAEDKGLSFDIELPKKPVMASSDIALLRTLVSNLLHNAIKYTQYGGRIWIRLYVSVKAVCIEVGDTGRGIAPEEQGLIFDRFYRGKGLESKERGSGLGLALVKQIVLAHGGEITLSSAAGRGSVFTVRLQQ